MATRIREGIPGKEKTLPRQSNLAQRKASTKTSPSSSRLPSPSRPTGANTKAPSSVPNSLKTTKSRPSVEPRTQSSAVKKPASAAASSEKTSLAKGRSSIKSPARASQSTRTLQSPNPKEKALRTSSSFSGSRSTGTTAQKGASNRIVKTAVNDVVKKVARPSSLKKSSNVTIKQNGESSGRASLSSSIMSSSEGLRDLEIVDVHHPQGDDHQSSDTEEAPINASSSHDYEATADVVNEEEQQTETPVQTKPDVHKQEDIKITESATPVQTEPDVHKQEDIKITESAIPVQTQPDVHKQEDIKITESATPVQTEPDVHKQEDIKVTESATSDVNNEVAAEGSFHPESQQLQEQVKENSSETTDAVIENLEVQPEDQGKEVGVATEVTEKKDEVKEEDQVVNLRETANVENIAQPEPELVPQSEPESKPKQEPTPAPAPAPEETKTVAAKPSNPVQAKKEPSGVSNDTIEETASKLQEQRRNRVRALAGAFESVMQQPRK